MSLEEAIKIVELFNARLADGSWIMTSDEEIKQFEQAMIVLDNQ